MKSPVASALEHSARQCVLVNMDFSGHNLSYADLSNGKFLNCNFSKCDMTMVQFFGARFKDCKFDGCSFSGLFFSDCLFEDCSFNGTGLIRVRDGAVTNWACRNKHGGIEVLFDNSYDSYENHVRNGAKLDFIRTIGNSDAGYDSDMLVRYAKKIWFDRVVTHVVYDKPAERMERDLDRDPVKIHSKISAKMLEHYPESMLVKNGRQLAHEKRLRVAFLRRNIMAMRSNIVVFPLMRKRMKELVDIVSRLP